MKILSDTSLLQAANRDGKMEKKKIKFLLAEQINHNSEFKIMTPDSISMMSAEALKAYIKKIITQRNTRLEIDLSGIHNIDNEWFDAFNFLSRLGRKYGSSITLTGVENDVMEIIELIRKYYFFDIQAVEPV